MKIRFTFHFNKKDPSFLEIKKDNVCKAEKREVTISHFPDTFKIPSSNYLMEFLVFIFIMDRDGERSSGAFLIPTSSERVRQV